MMITVLNFSRVLPAASHAGAGTRNLSLHMKNFGGWLLFYNH